MGLRLTVPSCTTALLASLSLGCDSGDRVANPPRERPPSAGEPPCDVGAKRFRPGISSGRRSVIVGCAQTDSGDEVQLYSFRDAGGPCIYIAGLPGGTRGCGRAPSERVPQFRRAIGGPAIVRPPEGPLELYGETSPAVDLLVLRYQLPDRGRARRRATLVRMRERSALRAAGIRRPFGYFVGTVPRQAKQVVAEARGESGEVLGRFAFDGIISSMHPTVFISNNE